MRVDHNKLALANSNRSQRIPLQAILVSTNENYELETETSVLCTLTDNSSPLEALEVFTCK